MTANEFADELDQRADRVDSFASPGYEDFDYTSVFTSAQWLYIKKFIDKVNNRKQHGFEETEIRNQGLSALIKNGTNLPLSSSQVGVITDGVFYDLPIDFMYAIYEEAVIDKTDCKYELPIVADIRDIAHGEITRFRRNKYKKPFYNITGESLVWRLNYQREVSGEVPASPATPKRHQLVTDNTFAVSNYIMNYLMLPPQIVVDRTTPANQRNCILDDSTHDVIIDIALDLLLNRVKEQKIANTVPIKELE